MPTILTDFGLAKSTATGSKYTRSGQALGTPAYMAPEQARGESALSPRADVWSLGCVLYEVLVGGRAFSGDTPAEVVAAVLTREPARLRAVRPDVPAGLDTILRVALSKSAGVRYASAHGFREDMDRVLRGERPRARVPVRRGRAVLVAGAVALVLLAGVLLRPRAATFLGTGPSPANALATDARARQRADPAAAAALFARALVEAPGRHDLRLELGLCHWSRGDAPAAIAAWAAIPAGAPEHTRAWWLTGLAWIHGPDGRVDGQGRNRIVAAWTTGAAGGGAEATCAAAGLALARGDFTTARRLLRGIETWDAALLQGLIASSAGRSDRAPDPAAGVRGYTRVLAEGPPLPGILLARAPLRAQMGDVDGARADHDAAVAMAPGDYRPLTQRGAFRAAYGDPVGALADLEAAVALAPADLPAILVTRADVRETLGDLAGARADLDAAVAGRPGHAETRAIRGGFRRNHGDEAGALADYTAALALDPDDPVTHYFRGILRGVQGDHAGARADYDAALAVRPGYREVRFMRARLRREVHDFPGARQDLDECLAGHPDWPDARMQRSEVRQQLGDVAGALADIEAVLAGDPDHADARIARAQARRLQHDPVGARADLDAVLARAPTHAVALHHRAILRRLAGDLAGARADIEAALVARPDYVAALSTRARYRLDQEDYVGARADLDAAIAHRPGDAENLTRRARVRGFLGDTAGAMADFDAALVAQPEFDEALLGRSQARAELGDLDGALADCEALVRVLPQYAEGHRGLGLLRMRRGEWARAAAALRQVLVLEPAHPYAGDIRDSLARCEQELAAAPGRG